MVSIAKHHFNADLDDYLKRRKQSSRKPFFGSGGDVSFERSEKKKPVSHMDVSEDDVKRVIENQPIQNREAYDNEPSSRGPGFFSKLFGSIRFSKNEDPHADVDMTTANVTHVREEKAKADPELIDALKIAGKWLNKLSPETKDEFRQTTDYAKYKFYLEKSGLTKKKE